MTKNNRLIRVGFVTGLVLLVPLALQLTIGTGVDGQGFNWQLGDFVVMGILLFATGLAIDSVRKLKRVHRILAIAVIALVFLLIWAELAVGIFGTPWAGS